MTIENELCAVVAAGALKLKAEAWNALPAERQAELAGHARAVAHLLAVDGREPKDLSERERELATAWAAYLKTAKQRLARAEGETGAFPVLVAEKK